jgi:hypothetical protein
MRSTASAAIAEQIVAQGGDYALALKGNQGTLLSHPKTGGDGFSSASGHLPMSCCTQIGSGSSLVQLEGQNCDYLTESIAISSCFIRI